MKVALVYDRVNKWGGAERVLLILHELFPKAPLFTSVYNASTAKWANVFPRVIPSFLQKFPNAAKRHDWYALLMPLAFESFDFSEYDLVISVTSEAAKGIITKPNTLHICYCLTPTRYLWSGYRFYFKTKIARAFSRPFVSYLGRWDKIAAQRPDVMLAISYTVKRRIKKYYKRDSKVIYPPLVFEQDTQKIQPKKSDYFLVVSRLVPYKRIDIAVRAFNKLGLPLVIVGDGSHRKYLQSIALPNIQFVGQVTENVLKKYYASCRALVFPQEEDFGLVAVEAQSFGKPVIAYKKGGALESVIEGKTGVFFAKQTVGSLIQSVEKFGKIRFQSKEIMQSVQKFAKDRFKQKFRTLVDKLLNNE